MGIVGWMLAVARADDPDPFQWLEDVYGADALAWVDRQDQRALSLLRGDPRYAAFRDEAFAILTADDRLALGQIHDGQVYGFWQSHDHPRGLWRRAPVDTYRSGAPAWETLIDYDALAALEGRSWVAGSIACLAPAYVHCMVELSDGGRDAGLWREFDTATGAFVDGFALPEAKASVTWFDADTLLVGTDLGPGSLTTSGYPRTVRVWRRGTALADAPILAEGAETDVSVGAVVERDGDDVHVLIARSPSFFRRAWSWTARLDQAPTALPLPEDADMHGMLDGRLVLTLREPWTQGGASYPIGAVVAYELAAGSVEPVLLPTANQSVEDVRVGETGLVVQLLKDVSGQALRLRRTRRGWVSAPIDLPANGVVSLVSVGGGTDEALVAFQSLTAPPELVAVDRKNRVRPIVRSAPAYDAATVIVEQRFATSADGTKVPYFLMGQRDVLAVGPAPTVQYAYGGFLNATLPVYFSESARPQHGALAGRLWVARGGVLVLSGIRGGSEYGPGWHAAALREHRQRAFDDFYAISRDLIDRGVTTAAQLGALGRSNGGLLMGVVQTQHPELYGAIVNGVPLYDMIRYTKLGAGASWIGEYGDPDVPAERDVLLTYSPYQRLAPGVRYPPVFFYTSTLDDRVHPGHARKAVARMEALGAEVYLYENREGGHGGTANQEELADLIALQYTFFAQKLMGAP